MIFAILGRGIWRRQRPKQERNSPRSVSFKTDKKENYTSRDEDLIFVEEQ